MGSSKNYLPTGGFREAHYHKIGEIAGIKVLEHDGAQKGTLPLYSNTPGTIYIAVNSQTGETQQIAVYGMDRRKTVDIDWGHPHENKGDGRYFERGEVHVHVYDEKGRRSRDGRKPTEMEQILFETVKGKIIKW